MLNRAEEKRKALPESEQHKIRFIQADLRTTDLTLPPVDLVSGLFVLHYADSPEAIGGMGRFIARNLKPDGQCALVTLSPDLNPTAYTLGDVRRQLIMLQAHFSPHP